MSADLPSAHDLYHRAPCGYITADSDGVIWLVNDTLLAWTGYRSDELVGSRFVDLLSPGGRIFHETHYAPLLQLQGEVHEIAFDLICADGHLLPVLVNSASVDSEIDGEGTIRTTVFDATLRHQYEQELLRARKRAEQSERDARSIALRLQESMLRGSATSGPGVQIAARYRPAVRSLEVGGDWYDAFVSNDDRALSVSIGDVVGHGLDAACTMSQLRSGLRALAHEGNTPVAVLDRLDTFAHTVPNALMTTVIYAQLDLDSLVLRYCSAGHPPPVLVRGDQTRLLEEGRRLPLLVDSGNEGHGAGLEQLRPGDGLILYTDGLVERRRRTINDGIDVLRSRASEGTGSAEDRAQALLEALLADVDGSDDVCLLYVLVDESNDAGSTITRSNAINRKPPREQEQVAGVVG